MTERPDRRSGSALLPYGADARVGRSKKRLTRARSGGLTVRALRYRAAQSLALIVLGALATAACAFGPLYLRAVSQAQLRQTLSNAPAQSRGLSVTNIKDPRTVETNLAAAGAARLFETPIANTRFDVQITGLKKTYVFAPVVSRDGSCARIHLVAGVCPSEPNDVVISATAAAVLGLGVGDSFPVVLEHDANEVTTVGKLYISGSYTVVDANNNYWFGRQFTSSAGGHSDKLDSGVPFFEADTFIGGPGLEDWFRGGYQSNAQVNSSELLVQRAVDAPLRVDRVHVSDTSLLRRAVRAVQPAQVDTVPALVQTDLPSLLSRVDSATSDARFLIVSFVVQIAILVLVVLFIVVLFAVSNRQPELAVARLRGWSSRRLTFVVSRELGLLVLCAALPGVVLAGVLMDVLCRTWLGGRARPELVPAAGLAVVAVVVVELVAIVAITRRAARQPVHNMLRRVPPRTSSARVGLFEAVVAAAAAAGAIVILQGDGRNAIAVVAPGLIALLAGLVLSRVLIMAAARVGRRQFWSGRVALGLAALQLGRNSAGRRMITVVCVAVALGTSALTQSHVATANRQARAPVEIGARVALQVNTKSATALRDAVAAADPSGKYAAPVAVETPVNAAPVVAVPSRAVGSVLGWGWPTDRPTATTLQRLDPPGRPEALRLDASDLTLRLTGLRISRRADVGGGDARPIQLVVSGRTANNALYNATFGPLPAGVTTFTQTLPVPCHSGCRLTQISLKHDQRDLTSVALESSVGLIAHVTSGPDRVVSLGAASDWTTIASPVSESSVPRDTFHLSTTGGASTITITMINGSVRLHHQDVPAALPVFLVGGYTPQSDSNGTISSAGLDGLETEYTAIGRMDYLPGIVGPALLVDYNLAAASTSTDQAGVIWYVWLSADNRSRESTLTSALAERDVQVVARNSSAARLDELSASAPSWAMQLAVVVAALAFLLAVAAMTVLASISRQDRTADLTALRRVGLAERTVRDSVLLERVVPVAVVSLAGAAVGVVAARLAIPAVPLFIDPRSEPAVHFSAGWTIPIGVGCALTGALAAVSAVIGWREGRQAVRLTRRGELE